MNTKRNRWLLAAMGFVALLYFGDLGYRKLYEEPQAANERLKEQLDERLKKAKLDLAKSKKVTEQLESLENRSLPWDAEMARDRYQKWLLQTAKDAKLVNTNVDSSNPIPKTRTDRKTRRTYEMFKRFTFSLNARGDLGQVTQFLYSFYRGGHLHKIRSMSLNPVGSEGQLNLSLSVEALALPFADREAELTSLVSEELAMDNVRDYYLISRRNVFGRGGANSAWKQIELTAVTSDVQGVAEAWFAVGSNKRTEIVRLGDSLSLTSLDLRVVQLDETKATATVALDGDLYLLSIGKNLAEASLLPAGE
jgi:hypothetical protein